jgi:putative cofactor-binding repeat protein
MRRVSAIPRLLGAAAVALTAVGLLLDATPLSPEASDRSTGRTTVRHTAAVSPTSTVDAERQSALLALEDQRLLGLVTSVRPGSGPYLQDLGGVQTLVLTARGLDYGLTDLVTLGAAEVQPDGGVLLTRHVFVAPGARLTVDAPGTTLRLRSDQSGFVSLVAWKADLTLSGAGGAPLAVTSWDPDLQRPDPSTVDGRAYVRDVSGSMQLRFVDASDLGFWAGRTSGVAWTGSSRAAATGGVISSTFRHNHYGAFASRGKGLTVADSDFSGNTVDGLLLHRSTADTTITNSTARDNGRHGFSADHGSELVSYKDVTAEANGAYGIFYSGTPLSVGQSAGGASLRAYGQVVVSGGTFRKNGKAGLRVVGGKDVDITDTRVADNTDGIVLAGTAAPTTVQRAVVTGNRRFGISVRSASATVTGNELSGGETAIHVRDAAVVVSGNTVRRATQHAISVVGAATGSSLEHNTIGGRGPSGIDVYRVDAGVTVAASGNDVRGWTRDRDNWTYWSTFVPTHPMLLLWVALLGVPLVLTLRGRHQRVRPGTPPYEDELHRERAPHQVHLERWITGGSA